MERTSALGRLQLRARYIRVSQRHLLSYGSNGRIVVLRAAKLYTLALAESCSLGSTPLPASASYVH